VTLWRTQRSEILAPAGVSSSNSKRRRGRKANNPTAFRPGSIPLHHPVG